MNESLKKTGRRKKRSSSNFEELRREAFNEKAKKKTYKVY